MSNTHKLSDSLQDVSGIGKISYDKLSRAGLEKIEDLLNYFPKRYIEFSHKQISDTSDSQFVILRGEISKIYSKKLNRLSTQTAEFSDQSGSITLRWFNQPYLARSIYPNTIYQIQGKIEKFRNAKQIVNPQISKATNTTESNKLTKILPVYKQAVDLNSRWLRKKITDILTQNPQIDDPISDKIIKKYHLISKKEAIYNIHFPKNTKLLNDAINRLSFEELFDLQLKSLHNKKQTSNNAIPISYKKDDMREFTQRLPFKLTNSQNQSIDNILTDLGSTQPMNRLLQGDVGTGKTIVSIAISYIVNLAGYKTVIMAPTQILAQQLFDSYKKMLKDLNIQLITGKVKPGDEFDILIGTHAVLNKSTEYFQNVALVIIDEQHKFGVKQRDYLKKIQTNPHVLTMTATPIPRTLALSIFSNLDISYLNEKPKSRLEVKTFLVPENKRKDSYAWITKMSKQNYRTFIVSPLIDDSEYETMKEVKSANQIYKSIKQYLPTLSSELIHGKLKEDDKNSIISKFREGKIDVLVSTTVIEVGIDVPEANIIIIESAERFGLSQLHQLRGRVGRSDKQGYCLVFTTDENQSYNQRLISFSKYTDGAKLAEIDLRLRGPGNLWGLKQHGFFNLKLASIYDSTLVKNTYEAAKEQLANSSLPD